MKYTQEELQRKRSDIKKRAGSDNRATRMTTVVGLNTIRPLPEVSDDVYFDHTVHIHFLPSPKGDNKWWPVTCLADGDPTRTDECPACILRMKLSDSTDQSDLDWAKKLLPQERHLVNVINKTNQNAHAYEVWNCPPKLFSDFIAILASPGNAKYDLMGEQTGVDFTFEKSVTGGQTRYSALQGLRESAPLPADWREQAAVLSEVNPKMSSEDITKILNGENPYEDNEQDNSQPSEQGKIAEEAKVAVQEEAVAVPKCFGEFDTTVAFCQQCAHGEACKQVNTIEESGIEKPGIEKPAPAPASGGVSLKDRVRGLRTAKQ